MPSTHNTFAYRWGLVIGGWGIEVGRLRLRHDRRLVQVFRGRALMFTVGHHYLDIGKFI